MRAVQWYAANGHGVASAEPLAATCEHLRRAYFCRCAPEFVGPLLVDGVYPALIQQEYKDEVVPEDCQSVQRRHLDHERAAGTEIAIQPTQLILMQWNMG